MASSAPQPTARPFVRERATGPFWYAQWWRKGKPVTRALGRAGWWRTAKVVGGAAAVAQRAAR